MPRTFYGPHGENNTTYANAGNANLGIKPLGLKLVLPDEREYRFSLNDGTAEVAGNLYQSVASVANHVNVTADVARAVGATVASATLGATAAAVDIYTEGIVHPNATAGQGYAYRIRRAMVAGQAHASAASSGVLTVNLVASETIQVALTTSSKLTFTRNRHHQILIHPSPPTAALSGVSPGVAAADRFYWSQTKGLASVLAQGTLYAGFEVMPSRTVDGAVESMKQLITTGATAAAAAGSGALLVDSAGTEGVLRIPTSVVSTTYDITGGIANRPGLSVGICVKANADTEYALIELGIF